MDDKKILLWLWLKIALNDNTTKTYKLYKQYCDIQKIYELVPTEIEDIPFLKDEDKAALLNKNIAKANETLFLCRSNSIDIITIDDDRYPKQFLNIYSPPCIIFTFGNYNLAMSKPKVTVVGTRKCTSYGEKITAKLSGALAMAGCTIVTGIAKGIDKIAIKNAVNADGSVISILPNGILTSNLMQLHSFEGLTYKGIILSEHLPGRQSTSFAYQERNRLLAGLSECCVVTQAPEKSGALMTANYALEQGKDVYVFPANVDIEASSGTNTLFKDGAIPITGYKDVLEPLMSKYGDVLHDRITESDLERFSRGQSPEEEYSAYINFKRIARQKLTDTEAAVFALINYSSVTIDYLLGKTDIPVPEMLAALSSLEAKGAIKKGSGNTYTITL